MHLIQKKQLSALEKSLGVKRSWTSIVPLWMNGSQLFSWNPQWNRQVLRMEWKLSLFF